MEERGLNEGVNNIICNVLHVDMVIFMIHFIVLFFHVEAKFVLK